MQPWSLPARSLLSLPRGRLHYVDTGGAGPTVVFVNAALTDESLWSAVIERLAPAHRCVALVLPLGAHSEPMPPGSDLSLVGQARMLADALDALGLQEVTLCFNDWSGAQILVAEGWTSRVGRLVLVSCETAGNYPPGLPGKFLALLGKVPGGLWMGYRAMRLPLATRLPFTFGRMTHTPISRRLIDRWFEPGRRNPAVRRDLRSYVSGVPAARRRIKAASERLNRFAGPVLVVWGAQDRVMPRDEGRALAAAFPSSTFVLVESSSTLVPLDQPGRLAELLSEYVGADG